MPVIIEPLDESPKINQFNNSGIFNLDSDFKDHSGRKTPNIFSSLEMKLSKNISRKQQITFIIMKSKLILKEYMRMFDLYLEKMRNKENNVPEQILVTTSNAI